MVFNQLTPEVISVIILTVFASSSIGFIVGILTKKKVLLEQKENHFKKTLAQERKINEDLLNQIKARDEFLAIASHELKTPLTTIILRVQDILESILNQSLANFSGEKLVKSLNMAQEQTRRLQKLIKDLLSFSLITRGKLDLELKDGDLTEIVRETLNRFEDHIKLAGCELNFKPNGQIIGLWDQIRLEQAISNLLTNAIKYGEGGPISVEVKKENNSAKILVADSGIGIESEKQRIIFDRFKRGTEDGKYQGLGVGLYIVKQIAEAGGGHVKVKSKLGKGSTFIIEIPIKDSVQIKQEA